MSKAQLIDPSTKEGKKYYTKESKERAKELPLKIKTLLEKEFGLTFCPYKDKGLEGDARNLAFSERFFVAESNGEKIYIGYSYIGWQPFIDVAKKQEKGIRIRGEFLDAFPLLGEEKTEENFLAEASKYVRA